MRSADQPAVRPRHLQSYIRHVSDSENLPSVNIVVVGVDASETALTAAREAASLAHRLGASLHIVSAVSSDSPIRVGTGSNEVVLTSITRAEQTLADVASRLGGDLVVTVAAAAITTATIRAIA